MHPAEKIEHKYSYADYVLWASEERWEIFEGVPKAMSPAPSRRHQEVLKNLALILGNFLQGKPCRLYFAPFDVRLAEKNARDEEVLTVVQPDLVVVCDESKLDDRGCLGSPDVTVEVLSPSTAAKDAREKLALYEKYGVKEYWMVYPEEKMIMVFILNAQGQYGKPLVFAGEDSLETPLFPGLKLSIPAVF